MVRFRTCDYTGEEIEPGTGIMLVRNSGEVLLCKDSKAEKNWRMGKNPTDLEWTEKSREEKARRKQNGSQKADPTKRSADLPGSQRADIDDSGYIGLLLAEKEGENAAATKGKYGESAGAILKEKQSMDETVQSVLRLLDKDHPYEANADTLRRRVDMLTEEVKASNRLKIDQVVASLGVLPVAPSEQEIELENELRKFADDIPVERPEDSKKYEWDELYSEVLLFLEEKESTYQHLEKEGIEGVSELRRKQVKTFLGDRLRYV
jgi:large subunit ribosomal protein L24e